MLQFPTVPLDHTAPVAAIHGSRAMVAVVDVARPVALLDAVAAAAYDAAFVPFTRGIGLRLPQGTEIVVCGPGLAAPDRLSLIATLAQQPGRLLLDVGADDLPIARARALRAGADDAVTWTVDGDETIVRVDALVRRLGRERAAGAVEAGPVTVDPVGREAFVDGVAVDLTAKEFDLLHLLVANPGRVFTRHELLVKVWQSSSAYQSQATVTEHVRRVRVKLGDRAPMLQTVRSVGYRFERRSADRSVELRPAG